MLFAQSIKKQVAIQSHSFVSEYTCKKNIYVYMKLTNDVIKFTLKMFLNYPCNNLTYKNYLFRDLMKYISNNMKHLNSNE